MTDGDKAPLRQRVKEWGEAAETWTRVFRVPGLLGVGYFKGDVVLDVILKLFGA